MGADRQARWLGLALASLVADRATKLAIETYTPETYHRVVIPRLVTLVHSHNRGIAFGVFAEARSNWVNILLVALSAAVATALLWLLWTGRVGGRVSQAGLALLLSGAVGNLIDRVLHGSVTDFFEVWIGSYRWPAFNVADSAITIGAALVALELLFTRHPPLDQRV